MSGVVIAYVAIIAKRTKTTERRLDELERDVKAREEEHRDDREVEHVA